MPTHTPRVFVCSTQVDLIQEREAVLEAIRKLQFEHHAMEYFDASTDQPIAVCLRQVRQSDILVVIVGHMYGTVVPGGARSYVETEYEEGYNLGKICLVYIKDERVAILPQHMEQDGKINKVVTKI